MQQHEMKFVTAEYWLQPDRKMHYEKKEILKNKNYHQTITNIKCMEKIFKKNNEEEKNVKQ